MTVSFFRGPASTCPAAFSCLLIVPAPFAPLFPPASEHYQVNLSFSTHPTLFFPRLSSKTLALLNTFSIGTNIMKFILATLALVASAQVTRSSPRVPVIRALINRFPVALHRFGSLRHLMPFPCTRQNDHSQRTADGDITLPIRQRQQHLDEWNKRRDDRFANTNPFHGGRQPSCWISWRSRSGCRRTCFRAMSILAVKSDVEAAW